MATRKMTDRAAEAWLSEPVTVHLFRDNGSYKEDKIVTVNGETVRIPRGEDVTIARRFALVLAQGEAQDARTRRAHRARDRPLCRRERCAGALSMATLQQALTRIDAICPNAWDDAAKIQWLNECEHMIQMRILDAAPEQCVTYDADTERGTPLLVPAPFDRLYVYYVIAMCDYAAHETAHYADSMALFNAALDEYAKWHQRTNGAAVPSPGQSHQIAMNSAMRHRHANKAVLDGITAERAAAWDQKSGQAEATPAAAGLMSAADKKKLDGMAQQTRIIHVGGDLSGTTADMTPAELYAYVSANPTHRVYAQLSFQGEHFLMLYQGATNGILTFSSLVADSERHTFCAVKLQAKTTGDVWDVPVRIELMTQNIAPAALPNPKALTIRIGGTTVMYDGSTAQTVTIADGTEVSY